MFNPRNFSGRWYLHACHSETTAIIAMNGPKARVIISKDDIDLEEGLFRGCGVGDGALDSGMPVD